MKKAGKEVFVITESERDEEYEIDGINVSANSPDIIIEDCYKTWRIFSSKSSI